MNPAVDFRLIPSDPRHFTAGKNRTDFGTGQLKQTRIINGKFIADGTVAGILPHDRWQQRMTADIDRYDTGTLRGDRHCFNLIGRIFDGYVVDFIHLRFVDFFNIFNIADIGITVGCLLLVISVLFYGRKEKKPVAETQTGSAAEAAAGSQPDYSEIQWDRIDEENGEQTVNEDATEGGTVDGR